MMIEILFWVKIVGFALLFIHACVTGENPMEEKKKPGCPHCCYRDRQ